MVRVVISLIMLAFMTGSAVAKCGIQWQRDIERFVGAAFQVDSRGLRKVDFELKDFAKDYDRYYSLKWVKKSSL